jgi:HAD superfamily hydrolase (TIGR01509 family)
LISMNFDGVIFDMDGTLIEPLLDFALIRADLGIPTGVGILEALDAMPPADALPLRRRLLEHELTAARQARLLPGAEQTLQHIRRAGLRLALLTRNAPQAMDIVLRRFGLAFDLAWSRDDGPIKPAPDGVLRACRQLGIAPARTACVGDFRYDLQAANAAGAVSILLARGPTRPDYADLAKHVIAELTELPEVLGI